MALNNILGVHGIVIPEEIDKDLYDKLMTLKDGTNARRDYIESLRPRLVRILDEYLDPRAAILACNLECRRILHDFQLQLENSLQNRHNIIKTHAHIIP